MKIGLLGSGNVGRALAKGMLSLQHEVYLATRDPEDPKVGSLKAEVAGALVCDFETAAKEGEIVVLCTPWDTAQDALERAGKENLKGKVVIDTNNPLQRGEKGVSRALDMYQSAGEMVQEWLPDSKVVKCFNTVGAATMFKPIFPISPTMFMAGNDADAKQQVRPLVEGFGWEPFDTGGIEMARELEGMAVIWINFSMSSGDPHHAFRML